MNVKEQYIGCSGFFYKDWKGTFYPDDIPQRLWLEYYAEEFNTVELNNTFYRLPKKSSFEQWYERTPANFRFAVKGNRYITHIKRLKDPDQTLPKFYDACASLQEKVGCVLWQLPPNLKKDLYLLRNFAEACSKSYVNVIEFRHLTWFDNEVYELLKEKNLVYCMISAPEDYPEEVIQTREKLVYLRFHGKTDWYRYLYSEKELSAWKEKLATLKVTKLYAFFNNDYDAHAITNARMFKEMLA